MTCKDVREMIPLYYYEELEVGLAGAVRTHLASCADCRKELALVGRVLGKVTAPEAPELPDEFWSRSAADIMRRVRKRPVKIIPASRMSPRFAVPLWAAAAAAAAVILYLSITMVDLGPKPDAVGKQVLVETPLMSDIEMDDIEIALDMEGIRSGMDKLWDFQHQESDDFDSQFTQSLDTIESSIDLLFMEFEAAGPRGIGVNGSV